MTDFTADPIRPIIYNDTRYHGIFIEPIKSIFEILKSNYLGHGFYQFSPEIFYSTLIPTNGFSQTIVILIDWDRPENWYYGAAAGAGEVC
jgi:hypothetical protein